MTTKCWKPFERHQTNLHTHPPAFPGKGCLHADCWGPRVQPDLCCNQWGFYRSLSDVPAGTPQAPMIFHTCTPLECWREGDIWIRLQTARFYSAYVKDTESLQINDKTKRYAAPENIWKIYSLCSAAQLHFYLVKNPNLSTHYLTPQTQSATEEHIRGYNKTSLQNFTQHFYSQENQMQACVEKHFTWKNVQVSGFNEWRINQTESFENNVSNIW